MEVDGEMNSPLLFRKSVHLRTGTDDMGQQQAGGQGRGRHGTSYLPAAISTDGCSSCFSDGVRRRIRPRQRRAIDTFCLMDEQLRDLPLQKDGIDEATETAPHVYACEVIQESSTPLRLYHFFLSSLTPTR